MVQKTVRIRTLPWWPEEDPDELIEQMKQHVVAMHEGQEKFLAITDWRPAKLGRWGHVGYGDFSRRQTTLATPVVEVRYSVEA